MASLPTSSWIGVGIACGGNILISLGLNSQKLAHQRLDAQANGSGTATPAKERQKQASQAQAQSAARAPALQRRRLARQHSGPPPSSPLRSPNGLAPLPIVVPEIQADGSVVLSPDGMGEIEEVLLDEAGSDLNATWSRKADAHAHAVSPIPEAAEEDTDGGEGNGEGEGKEVYLKSRLWWAGLALCAVGEAGNFLSYGFAPASVVAPLGTVALVANCFVSPFMLGEHLGWRDLVGVLLAIVGAVTVVISARDSNQALDPKSLLHAIKQPAFVGYTIANVVVIAILLAITHSKRFGNRWIGIDIGICALFGGYTVLSTKALSSLLSRMFVKIFRYPITWVLIVVLVATSVLQIRYLNRALMAFEGKQVIPTQFVFFSVSAIVGSAVLYQEFRNVTFSRMLNFLFGVATTFLGVFLLTAKGQEDDDEEQPAAHDQSRRGSLLAVPIETAPLLPTISRSSANGGYHAISSKPIRLRKRSSTSSLRPGLNSGAFLLMATTPPPSHSVSGSLGRSAGARSRSASRSGQHGQA